ncbi:hypothetical protein E4U17_003502 [Claviceps sp. LM77 group G4]|nr:hypothetical protein E4U17_003502 [Claviceps sp. LM77 group G4]KAG6079556.1 hypothetical protein E4U16_000986 [Claviceps sp. LM84 group G4]
MAPSFGPLTRAYYRWKTLRLPWRKRFFIGYDLQGNTYWEFKLTSADTRMRRIVNYPSKTYNSQVKVPPLWHQWLRYARNTPPSLDEQHGDVLRKERMKVLAAEADARWEAKPRLLATDEPSQATLGAGAKAAINVESKTQQQQQQQQQQMKAGGGGAEGAETAQGAQSSVKDVDDADDSWEKAKKAQKVADKWQPTAWDPSSKS